MYHAFEQNEESHDAWRELERFVDTFQLDVYISICQMDYVGTDTADTTFYVQEMYNEMFQLCQVWKDGKGRTLAYIP